MISKNLSLTAPPLSHPLSHPLSPPPPSAYSERLAVSVHMAGNFGHNHQRNPSKGTHEKKWDKISSPLRRLLGVESCAAYNTYFQVDIPGAWLRRERSCRRPLPSPAVVTRRRHPPPAVAGTTVQGRNVAASQRPSVVLRPRWHTIIINSQRDALVKCYSRLLDATNTETKTNLLWTKQIRSRLDNNKNQNKETCENLKKEKRHCYYYCCCYYY